MAIEDAINNLAAAIDRFADLLGAAPPDRTIHANQVVKGFSVGDLPKETKKAEKPAPTPTVQLTAAEPESATESPSEEVSTQNVSETFFAKAQALIESKGGIEKAKVVLTELGFPKFKLVPANLHAKGLGLVEAQLND